MQQQRHSNFKEMGNREQDIINVAMDLFSKKGFAATSMREIAKASGVSHSLINYYFRSKDKLLKEFIEKRSKAIMESIKLVVQKQISECEKIDLLVNLYVKQAFSNRELSLIFFQEQLTVSYPELGKLMSKLDKTNCAYFTLILENGQEKNFFYPDINPRLIYYSIMGTIQQSVSAFTHNASQTEILSEDDLINYLKAMYKKMILKPVRKD